MASPIQVVLNPENFNGDRRKGGGGESTDFYADRDDEFHAHKNKIKNQLEAVQKSLEESPFSQVAFAKVILEQSALAKSHRPTKSLFKSDVAPVVGAGDLGELYALVTPLGISKMLKKIDQAEEVTTRRETEDGKVIIAPSRAKSEVGAIKEVKPYSTADKRKFSVADGLKWLSDPRTGGAYIVELFETPPPRQEWDLLPPQMVRLFQSFADGLSAMGQGLTASRLSDNFRGYPLMGVKVGTTPEQASIQLSPSSTQPPRKPGGTALDMNVDRHTHLLEFLDKHPLVKKIILPPIISQSNAAATAAGTKVDLALPAKDKPYPKVAIVDGGVSDVIGPWLEKRFDYVADADKNTMHGTFIAGLLVAGAKMNSNVVCPEFDGCKIIDLDLLPIDTAFGNYYPKPLDFFSALEDAVKVLKASTGVRIFNFSLNIDTHVSADGYNPAAKLLDRISEENDVIFIISAGNTKPNDVRLEWSENPTETLSSLANARNDTLKVPSESARNLTIGALNPPGLKHVVPTAPAAYSCRGPGIRIGVKPDLAHFGGSHKKCPTNGHGLHSIEANGLKVDDCGTSYATPLVAKTLASLDSQIEGDVSRETLIALAIHHARLPDILRKDEYKDLARYMAGFGIPASSSEILVGSDNSISLVFANRLMTGKQMNFKFAWPASLVKNQKCYGHTRLTLVSTPPFDYRYGAEFVRVNLDARLRQEKQLGSEKYQTRAEPIYLPNAEAHHFEPDLIKHGLKWSPIKVYERKLNGLGPSTNWRLDVEYLERDDEEMPKQGVPFTVILTISDPKGDAPVFQEMRQFLQAQNINTVDIRTAARVVTRI
jgi:Subtilase family